MCGSSISVSKSLPGRENETVLPETEIDRSLSAIKETSSSGKMTRSKGALGYREEEQILIN
jgi:hypothetical protein